MIKPDQFDMHCGSRNQGTLLAISRNFFDQRDELNQEIQTKIAEWPRLISSEFERDRRSGEIGATA